MPESVLCYQVNMQREITWQHDLKALREIKQLLSQLKPDIVHCHSAKAGVLGRLAAKQLNIPACYSPHCYSFLRTDISWVKRAFYYLIELCIAKYTKALTIASGQSEYRLAKFISRVTYIANCVAVNSLNHYQRSHSHIILTIGRITVQKGVARYIKITKVAPKNFKFVWVGDGELRAMLANLPNVIVTGWLQPHELKKYLQKAEVVLQPSNWEVLPTALLEAASAAKPLVCSDIAGHHDFIKNSYNGKLFKTTRQAITIINDLFSRADMKQHIATNAYNTVKQKFNANDLSAQYLKCYKNLKYAKIVSAKNLEP